MLETSLVSKPSHRPLFDSLQFAKPKSGGLIYFIMPHCYELRYHIHTLLSMFQLQAHVCY